MEDYNSEFALDDKVVDPVCGMSAKKGRITYPMNTAAQKDDVRLETYAEMRQAEQGPFPEIRAKGSTGAHLASMVMSLRPYNPEGSL